MNSDIRDRPVGSRKGSTRPTATACWFADDIAHFIGVLSPALTSWLGHKKYTFKQS